MSYGHRAASRLGKSQQRIGPVMRALADYVSAVPGCSVRQALRGIGHPDCGLGAYRPVERAVAAGLLVLDRDNSMRTEHSGVHTGGDQDQLGSPVPQDTCASLPNLWRFHGSGVGAVTRTDHLGSVRPGSAGAGGLSGNLEPCHPGTPRAVLPVSKLVTGDAGGTLAAGGIPAEGRRRVYPGSTWASWRRDVTSSFRKILRRW